MMHYGPWIHHQGILDNRQCYNQYIEEVQAFRHPREQQDEELKHTVEEIQETPDIEVGTSGERSSSADLFRLEFAATQWSKLVSNAEGLFNKLVTSNILPHTEQDQIEQWLCMKQEYEECIASDDTASLQGFADVTRRSLERIEEVTETDEKTDESATCGKFRNESDSSCNSETEDLSEEESDISSENPDFLDKLDELMNKFKNDTDNVIDSKKDEFRKMDIIIDTSAAESLNNGNDYLPIVKPTPIRNPSSRRNSMLPGSDMCNGVLAFNGGYKQCQDTNFNHQLSALIAANTLENREVDFRLDNNVNVVKIQKETHSPDLLIETIKNSDQDPEPIKVLKNLTLTNEAKQTQVKKIQSDLEGAHKRIEELQNTIQIKEQFIADMIKNSEARASAKQKFQRKRSKLEEEYYNTRTQLAQAENASLYKDTEDKSAHKKEIELYKHMAIHYEKRLMDIEMIKQIAGDSAKKVLELESSLNSSKKQMEKLKRQLKKEDEHKKQLENELVQDQRKIRELEEKYNLTASKLKEIQSESEDDRKNSKSQNDCSDKKKNLLEVSARISHLDHVLKEKSMDLERTADTDEKEALRHEIRNLRRTRDCLVDEKCDLDEKLQKEKTLTIVEERKLLECGETIEAIDAMIEHKNEMICGRKCFDENQVKREKGEQMLMERLMKLSDGEMRTLFYKYFLKVIDLKESSKNLEIQAAELEAHAETQEWRIQTLTNALKQTKLEAERRIVLMQREHEEKLHLMFRHFAEETSSSGHDRLDKDSELARCKRENRSLRRRLADVEGLLKGSTHPRAASPAKIPQQGLKQIAPSTQPTTKVTRQRNKLIIQKTIDTDKRHK
ncbi:kinesin-like protein costa [Neodiprion pinetum]|uniref:kinesin-like protein costa n=1 Tax=Neodiprion pinetum TaxID=441929 RepID=UPI001EE089B2|nr:kinesin-like protein costa [Neodiprion pinetum]XP_046464810.1 kinesin-like protein costa [Neodiprion pinetum]